MSDRHKERMSPAGGNEEDKPDTLTGGSKKSKNRDPRLNRDRLQLLAGSLGEYIEFGVIFSFRALEKLWRGETQYSIITLGLAGTDLENHLKKFLDDKGIVLHNHQHPEECTNCQNDSRLSNELIRDKKVQCTRLTIPEELTKRDMEWTCPRACPPTYLCGKNYHILIHSQPAMFLEPLWQ